MKLKYLIPLIVFVVMSVFLFVGLYMNPKIVRPVNIDKAAPAFELQNLHQMTEKVSNSSLLGKVWMLNVWASWCVACRQEHPYLVELARAGDIPLYGLNYKDAPSDGRRWLEQHGNPYLMSFVDYQGNVGIDYGVYGVPETFIIDKKGVIRHKVIGPLSGREIRTCVRPVVKYLEQNELVNNTVPSEVTKECSK
ncbi:MAG: DsbE family thiol:disulfide interchange protein [Gammaproteobacteria bacterium]|nr:DsbE family thiol:disulfide interchange protein [Gammaproteobacteria bacterium]MDH5800837.1 DsbE family thiol:disulfide interchange protein [Gammaproteobacteria bacterium]